MVQGKGDMLVEDWGRDTEALTCGSTEIVDLSEGISGKRREKAGVLLRPQAALISEHHCGLVEVMCLALVSNVLGGFNLPDDSVSDSLELGRIRVEQQKAPLSSARETVTRVVSAW